jgi:SAM-dependent methyltransferase
MPFYRTLKSAYQTLIPERLRRISYDRNYPFHYVVDPIKSVLRLIAPHEDIYDRRYYAETVEPLIKMSAGIMAESIVSEFHPTLVVDVGCGTGELLYALKRLGVDGVGFEGSAAAIEMARAKGIEVAHLDLEQPIDKLEVRPANLAISTEVAEHLPQRFAKTFVEYLCRCANTVVMTAATPGQGGFDHVNEQHNEYWIAKFRDRNFAYDSEQTARLRRQWKEAKVAVCYHANLMIFHKSAGA